MKKVLFYAFLLPAFVGMMFSCSDVKTDVKKLEGKWNVVEVKGEKVMKWSGRTALVVFTGLGGLKGMLVPVSETYKKKMLYRAVQTLPGVGSSIETVTQTVWGAAKIIKNGIGMAAVIAVLIVCAVPVLKLVLMAVLFKVTAAVIEPVADKRVVKAVNALGTAVGMLLMTVLAAVSLFLLMLAMIVMMTGLQ